MTLSLFLTIHQITMGAIMALGGQLIFGNVPSELKGSRIHSSSRVMGIAMMIIPISSLIFYAFNLRDYGTEYATATNLSAYCVTSTLITLAYYILLNQVRDKLFMKIHLMLGLIYPIPLWIGICSGSKCVVEHTIITAYTVYFVLAATHISTCIYFYKQWLKNLDSDITELQKLELKLLKKTMYISTGLIFIALCSPSSSSYPLWLVLVFVVCFVSGIIYIYSCFHRILSRNIHSLITYHEPIYMTSEMDEDEDIDTTTPLSDETKSNIERHLKKWLAKKEFIQPRILIGDVAKEACTNRTYLSKYINTVYNCSFKSWVTLLRIDEAKELMRDNPELSISDVAKRTGFASVESFSHIFNRYEKISPSRWREDSVI